MALLREDVVVDAVALMMHPRVSAAFLPAETNNNKQRSSSVRLLVSPAMTLDVSAEAYRANADR